MKISLKAVDVVQVMRLDKTTSAYLSTIVFMLFYSTFQVLLLHG